MLGEHDDNGSLSGEFFSILCMYLWIFAEGKRKDKNSNYTLTNIFNILMIIVLFGD